MMTTTMSQNTEGMTRDEIIALKNKRTAVTVFQISWIMVFVCLILVNLQIRANFPSWPPPGVAELDKILPTIATLALIGSTALARQGLRAASRGEKDTFLKPWRMAIMLGAVFAVIMAVQWFTVEISGQYSTIFRVMVAYHGIHALVIGYLMIRVYATGKADGYTARHYFPVEAAAKLWYFVTVAWLLFYVVLYII